MQNYVFVLDSNKKPCDMMHPAAVRILLREKKARVLRRYPFTIILTAPVETPPDYDYSAKFDYGSRTTGIVIVRERGSYRQVVWACELSHRGHVVKKKMQKRSRQRRSRRNRKTRYRKARFDNRRRAPGWLPPSIESRISNIDTWAGRFFRWVPLTRFSVEHVKFDTQKMQNAEISGVEYQQGELAGYEVRQYLLEKFKRKCVYCGIHSVPLQIEHIVPKAKGGTNRVSNLTIACEKCNRKKGSMSIEKFLAKDRKKLDKIKENVRTPLKDAASVNYMRWLILERLGKYELPIELGSGALTKFNRTKQGYGKTHFVDAACVGASGRNTIVDDKMNVLYIDAMGHGMRRFRNHDSKGFPCSEPFERVRVYYGFATGDIVYANVPKGMDKGVYYGRISVRKSGFFGLKEATINYRYCKKIQNKDGYEYMTKNQISESERRKKIKKKEREERTRIRKEKNNNNNIKPQKKKNTAKKNNGTKEKAVSNEQQKKRKKHDNAHIPSGQKQQSHQATVVIA